MVTAIVYTSNSGYTKEYAEMLSRLSGLPAYNLQNSIPPAARGKDVLYMGWLFAGNLQGYDKAAKLFSVVAVCPVGMAPATPDADSEQEKQLVERYGKDGRPVFYLLGGFDINRLKGIKKFMMTFMSKHIVKLYQSKDTHTESEDMTYKMATEGCSAVSEAHLGPVLDWLSSAK